MKKILRGLLLVTLVLATLITAGIAKGTPGIPGMWLFPIGFAALFGAVYYGTGGIAVVAALAILSTLPTPAEASKMGDAPFCSYDGYLMQCYYYSWSACEQAVKHNPNARCVANPEKRGYRWTH